jgi:hypothetical protein
MSLRKGSLQDYYNSGPGAKSADCKVIPGVKPTCYEDKIEPNTINKLYLYANPPKN